MKYKTSDKLRPPPHVFYGDSFERGNDPWHNKGLVGTPAEGMGNTGPIRSGWFLLDAWKNQIGFVADGTEYEVMPTDLRKFPADLRDELIRQGAEAYADSLEQRDSPQR